MKKIKILRIIARLNIGGPAIHTILLSDCLDKERFETLLACGQLSKDEGDMFYYATEKNVHPKFLPELKREIGLFNDLKAFCRIYRLVKSEKPDIIHTHTAKAGTLGRLAGIFYNLFKKRSHRVRLVHTFHGHIFSGYFNKLKSGIFILIERFLALFTCRIITVSDTMKHELLSFKICAAEKIEVIPLGFELDRFLNIPFKDSASNIGIVGRLTAIKNHRLFLMAAAKVIENNPQMKLRFKIIGDGELRRELEKYSRQLNINDNVVFLGWQKDLVRVYTELDIVALTSINEGTPVSLIEAMASGRPVVAADAGGVKDLLGGVIQAGIGPNANFKVLERGIIVKPHDPDSFAAALTLLLKDSALRKKIRLPAREFIKKTFTSQRLIMDIENLYSRLVR